MKNTKKVLKVAFILELLVGLYLLLIYKPAGCTVDCLNGLNEFAVYLLPLVGLTAFIYIWVKVNEASSNRQHLKPDQKFTQFFVFVIVLLMIIYGLYYLFNR